MYHLGSTYGDEVVRIAVKLGHPMLTKNVDYITTAAMWQKSKKSNNPKVLCWDIYQITLVQDW